jgi:opacity protein-like surface antigen
MVSSTFTTQYSQKGGGMKKEWLNLVRVIICCSLFLYACPALCGTDSEPNAEQSKMCLKRVTMLTGYGSASMEDGHYEVVPILIQFHFDINPFVQKLGVKTGGDFEFIAEPLMNVVTNPNANAEVGISFLLRYEDTIVSRLRWFFEGGVGAMYTSQHTQEQGSQYDFLPQAGLGLQYSLTKKLALTGEYRWRHMSNAGATSPNHGLNHNFALVGLTYFFNN